LPKILSQIVTSQPIESVGNPNSVRRMHASILRFSAVPLMVACNAKPMTEGDPGVVRGVAIQHDVTERGIVDRPRDLSAAMFGPDGRAAAGSPDGSFAIPAGDWLEIKLGGERLFLPAGSSAPDLSYYRYGRSDLKLPITSTPVAFDISSLSDWQPGDSLQIVVPNAGVTMDGPETMLATPPGAGATAIGGGFDWKANQAPILDAAGGDTTWVAQMAVNPTADGRTYYRALTRAAVARGFTVVDGQPAILAAALVPVAQPRQLTLRWKGSEFAALAAQAGPGARPAPAPALAIRALPEPLARHSSLFNRLYTALPTLVELGPISGSEDIDQPVAFGDPFGAAGGAWTEFVTVVYPMPVAIRTPQGSASLSAMIVAAVPVSALDAAGVIAPLLSPVREPRIAGAPLDVPRTGVGTSPTLTWQPPEIRTSTSTSYRVVVYALDGSPLGVNASRIATLHTTATSLQIPASVLTPGGSYVVAITAIAGDDTDLATRPFSASLPYAAADYVSAVITP
jgi:hypothetical protein